MKFKKPDRQALDEAKHLIKWEELLSEAFTLIRGKKQKPEMEGVFETALCLFIENNLASVQPLLVDSHQALVAASGRSSPRTPPGRSHLRFMVKLFGIDAMTAVVYNMLSVRACNGLLSFDWYLRKKDERVERKFIPLNELVACTPQQLMKARNVGRVSVAEIEAALGYFGLKLGMTESEIETAFSQKEE